MTQKLTYEDELVTTVDWWPGRAGVRVVCEDIADTANEPRLVLSVSWTA